MLASYRPFVALVLALALSACATPTAEPSSSFWTDQYLYTSYAAKRGIY